jgi:cell shape-determining protein MreC
MKSTRFLQQHRARGRFPFRALHLALIAGALLVSFASPAWLEEGILSFTGPVWRMRSALAQGIVSTTRRLMSREELETENARLREENARLSIRGALYDELMADVVRLESLAGRAPAGERRIVGHVLASPSASPYDSFLIDIGSADGIARGDRVIFDDSIELGFIDLVTDHSARVSLLSSPGAKHEVYIGTVSARLEAIGQGGGMFIVKAPKELRISASDAVMSAGTREAIALVHAVEAGDSDAFQTVYAVMPVNLFETREVLVERSGIIQR